MSVKLPKNQKLYSVRYCYQKCGYNSNSQLNKKAIYYGKKISFWLTIATVISMVHSTYMETLTFVIPIILIIGFFLKKILDSFSNKIDLNKIEIYLTNITNVVQVISLELYHLTPKVRILHIYLKVNIPDLAEADYLKKQINSNLWGKFGITQSLIQMTSEINNPEKFCITKNLSDLETIEIKPEEYLNLTRQAYIELN